LGDELHNEERVINDFVWFSLTLDQVDLYELSLKEYISVKLNRLFWVDGWKMLKSEKVSFGNGFRRF
jgi:hypothetical protein